MEIDGGDNGLWAKVFSGKYIDHWVSYSDKTALALLALGNVFLKGLNFCMNGYFGEFGNGNTVKVWTDKWAKCGILLHHGSCPLFNDML